MPDWASEVLAIDGLSWLLLAVCVAGTVRGFAGFGSAMIIMPVDDRRETLMEKIAAISTMAHSSAGIANRL